VPALVGRDVRELDGLVLADDPLQRVFWYLDVGGAVQLVEALGQP
jgi:hypothetical protein